MKRTADLSESDNIVKVFGAPVKRSSVSVHREKFPVKQRQVTNEIYMRQSKKSILANKSTIARNYLGQLRIRLLFYVYPGADSDEVVEFLHVFIEQRDTAQGPIDFCAVEGFVIRSVNADSAAEAGITG